jgi:hypothetical protein
MILLLIKSVFAYPLDEHRQLTQQAFTLLEQCSIALNNDRQEEIIVQNLQEDINVLQKWTQYSHYYNPNRPLGIRRSSSLDRIRDLEDHQNNTGVLIHHLQDLTLPLHVLPIGHTWRDGLESLPVELTTFPVDCEFIKERSNSTPEELIKLTAQETLIDYKEYHLTSSEGSKIPLAAFWFESEEGYGDYVSNNIFGNTTIEWENNTYEIPYSEYVAYKQSRHNQAIEQTMILLYKYLQLQ